MAKGRQSHRRVVVVPPGVNLPSYGRRRHSAARARRRFAARLAWKASKTVAARSYRHRRPLAPVYTTGVLYAAGATLAHVPHGVGTVPVAAAVAGGVLWRRSRSWRPEEKRYAAATGAACAAWLEAASVVGAGPPLPGLLGALFAAAAPPWWWHHHVHRAPPAPPVVVGDVADTRVSTWVDAVAAPGYALPGSQLAAVRETGTGWAADIELPAGKLTTEDAVAATARIASAYRMPRTSVVVEAPADHREGNARLVMLTSEQNPLRQVGEFQGPRLDPLTGRFPCGVYADGGEASWKLWTPGSGACMGLIIGTTGSGKSGFVSLLCAEVRHSARAVLWLADPQHGESVPEWQDCPDGDFWFAGTESEIRAMLRAARDVLIARQERRSKTVWHDRGPDGRKRRHRGYGFFDPTPQEPLLNIVIDEAPKVLAIPECNQIISMIVTTGRKVGVGVTVVTQVPSLDQMGGNLEVRSMLASTNVVCFRTSDAYSKQMGMPGSLPVRPQDLPEEWPDGSTTAGLGFAASTQARFSAMRAPRVSDAWAWAMDPAPAAMLELPSRLAAGPAFTSWRERRDHGVEWVPEVEPTPTAATVVTEPEPGLSTAERDARIVAVLAEHGEPMTTGTVAKRTGFPLSTVSTRLGKLADTGRVVNAGHGVWQAALQPVEA